MKVESQITPQQAITRLSEAVPNSQALIDTFLRATDENRLAREIPQGNTEFWQRVAVFGNSRTGFPPETAGMVLFNGKYIVRRYCYQGHMEEDTSKGLVLAFYQFSHILSTAPKNLEDLYQNWEGKGTSYRDYIAHSAGSHGIGAHDFVLHTPSDGIPLTSPFYNWILDTARECSILETRLATKQKI